MIGMCRKSLYIKNSPAAKTGSGNTCRIISINQKRSAITGTGITGHSEVTTSTNGNYKIGYAAEEGYGFYSCDDWRIVRLVGACVPPVA